MLSSYDYLGILFYITFIVGVGLFYSRKSKNTSDYFRGGGVMPWWIAGAAAWMGSFSAWTFTGAAGKIYETGPYVLCLYFASIPSLLLVLAFVCFRFRRMRVVTPLEAVRLRFGKGSQQFYTWIRLPFLIFFSGVGLNAVGVFMAAIFQIDINLTLIVLGLVVLSVSMLGGTFAVAASDFVQMFLVVTVAITTAFLALRQPEVGGVAGLLDRVPDRHFEWGQIASPGFILMWMLALAVNNIIGASSIENSSKFLMTRSDRHARLMLIIPIVGTLLGPIIWLVPPMVAAVTHPGLAGEFPALRFPHEAAFLATALDVLPNGMLGLLVCGIFAATLTSLDAGLNQAAGIYVRNFHLPVVNPECSEKSLLWISKGCTAVFGVLIITIAIIFNHFRSLSLFDLLNQLGVSLWLPLAIPLAVGLFYKRTPAWSTWSTVVIGLAASFGVNHFFSGMGAHDTVGRTIRWVAVNLDGLELSAETLKQLGGELTGVRYVYQGPAWLESMLGGLGALRSEEVVSFSLILTVALLTLICVGWFFFTSLFYERSTPEYKASVDEFAARLRQPMGERDGEEVQENTAMELSIGRLCLIYGASILLMAAIPNPAEGRLAFVFCGGVMALVGGGLMWHYRVKTAKVAGV